MSKELEPKRSARDIIARVYDDATIATDGESAYVWADELLGELSEHGYSIVEHVEPSSDPDCGQVWLAGSRFDGFHLITEPGLIWDFGGNEYTVDEARSYAAAMLSAAAAASPTAQEKS